MYHRNDMRAVMIVDGTQPVAHTLIRRDVHGNVRASGWGRYGCLAIETDNVFKAPGKPAHYGCADRAVRPCNYDDPTVGCVHE